MSTVDLNIPDDLLAEFLNRLNSPIPVREFRDKFKDMLEKTKDTNIVLTRHGKPSAVILDYELFEGIQKMFNQFIKQQLKNKSRELMKNSLKDSPKTKKNQSDEEIYNIIDQVIAQDRKERGIK